MVCSVGMLWALSACQRPAAPCGHNWHEVSALVASHPDSAPPRRASFFMLSRLLLYYIRLPAQAQRLPAAPTAMPAHPAGIICKKISDG